MKQSKRRSIIGVLGAAALGLGLLAGPMASANHAGALSTAGLDGAQEIAADGSSNAGDPDGRGRASVFSTGGGVVCYVLEVRRIGHATAAHIHLGNPGENGPVVVTLGAPTNGESAGCIDTGDSDLAAAITLNAPQHYYVNVHNAEFPGGAVRGQLG